VHHKVYINPSMYIRCKLDWANSEAFRDGEDDARIETLLEFLHPIRVWNNGSGSSSLQLQEEGAMTQIIIETSIVFAHM
jgi:hypothetical protein